MRKRGATTVTQVKQAFALKSTNSLEIGLRNAAGAAGGPIRDLTRSGPRRLEFGLRPVFRQIFSLQLCMISFKFLDFRVLRWLPLCSVRPVPADTTRPLPTPQSQVKHAVQQSNFKNDPFLLLEPSSSVLAAYVRSHERGRSGTKALLTVLNWRRCRPKKPAFSIFELVELSFVVSLFSKLFEHRQKQKQKRFPSLIPSH